MRREGTACDNTRPGPKLQGGATEGHGSLGEEGGRLGDFTVTTIKFTVDFPKLKNVYGPKK